jgi:hypothetical protein
VQADEAHDSRHSPTEGGGLGSLSDTGRTIHAGCGSSPVGVSCPPVTSSSSDSRVAADVTTRPGKYRTIA